MKLLDYYVSLRLHQAERNLPDRMPVTVNDLAHILCCTERNIKILLKKMTEQNWLIWEPGRGRGRISTLTFLQDFRTSMISKFQELLNKEELNKAIDLLKENIPADLKEEMHHMLNSHFGYLEKGTETAKDVLRIPMTRRLSSLDPSLVAVSTESHFSRQIYDTLLEYDETEEIFKPHLAHAFDVSRDGKTITFYLRKGTNFHHGKPLTSRDVLYTFQRLTDQNLNSPCKWQTALIESVVCNGPYVIQFRLKRKTRMFLHFVSSISMAVQPEDGSKLTGTGPFSVRLFNEDVLMLEANPYYFKERAWLDLIEIWRIPSNSKVDMHYELPELTHSKKEKAVDFLQVGCNYLMFNLHKPNIIHDINLRQAVFHLLDSQLLIEELGDGRKLASTSLFPEKSLEIPPVEKSIKKAAFFLRESGYNGEPLKISFFDMKHSRSDADWLKKRAEKIGLNLVLHPFPLTDYYKEDVTADTDMIIMGEMFETNVVLAFINFFKNSASFFNRFLAGEHEERIQSLVDLLMDEEEPVKQIELMERIEQYLYDQRLLLNSYHTYRKKNFPSNLKNVSMNTFGWADFRKLWIKPFNHETTF